nr:CDP-glucose 4,6-dehydratase [Vibrio neptunius]
MNLGAKVCGISKDIPTKPSIFEECNLENDIEHHFADIRDFNKIKSIIEEFEPDFLFHLAAQPIVSKSYSEPLDTISSNVMGTAHILEVLRDVSFECTAVIITSDKCYENVEWLWGYKETDALGGKDIYSGSKGAAEVIFHAYHSSFFPLGHNVSLATGRAGNVIGGGDWAEDRIVADCMRAWSTDNKVEIRCPEATRPWQHVLEPLSGYLHLGMMLDKERSLSGQQFNFGPRAEQNHTVKDLLSDLSNHWGFEDEHDAFQVTDNIPFNEAGLLKLNCDKALSYLKWEATLDYSTCVEFVSEWYVNFYKGSRSPRDFTNSQIHAYESIAREKGVAWAF